MCQAAGSNTVTTPIQIERRPRSDSESSTSSTGSTSSLSTSPERKGGCDSTVMAFLSLSNVRPEQQIRIRALIAKHCPQGI